jgi:hypothetical protein
MVLTGCSATTSRISLYSTHLLDVGPSATGPTGCLDKQEQLLKLRGKWEANMSGGDNSDLGEPASIGNESVPTDRWKKLEQLSTRQGVQYGGLIAGALLLVVGLLGVLIPQLAVFGVPFFALIACAGLGAVLAALGDQARVTHPGIVLTGASAIAIAFYLVWHNGYQKIQDLMYKAEVRVIGSSSGAITDNSRVVLSVENDPILFVDAPIERNAYGAIAAELRMPYQMAAKFRESNCSTVEIVDKDKMPIFLYDFVASTTMPADLSLVFQLIYDVTEKKLLYTKNASPREEALPCGRSKQTESQKEAVQIINSAKQETTDSPVSSPQKVAEAAKKLPAKEDVIGWTYYGTKDHAGNGYNERFYENQTRPKAKVPSVNDVLEAQAHVKLRSGPRTFNGSTGQYETPSELLTIQKGQRIRVGGSPVVVKDIGVWVPVREVLSN